jgi:RHS repeat-associated protein
LLRTDAAGPRSFLTDGLGSTLALTDSAGLVQNEYTYEPFGKTTTTGVASTNAFKYTGREDDGTGLYYYRARYYHPALQRFVSEDPIVLGVRSCINTLCMIARPDPFFAFFARIT